MRLFWFASGWLMVGLGVIGAFVPLMPTTIFLILGAACFARSSPRLEAWLLDHPRFGPPIRGWRDHRVIPTRAKVMACSGIAIGLALFLFFAHPQPWLAALVSLLMLACAGFIITRAAHPPTES